MNKVETLSEVKIYKDPDGYLYVMEGDTVLNLYAAEAVIHKSGARELKMSPVRALRTSREN